MTHKMLDGFLISAGRLEDGKLTMESKNESLEDEFLFNFHVVKMCF